MNPPIIHFKFSASMDMCDITVEQDGKEASYSDLRVKKVNLRDWQEPEMVYQVFIPCRKALGRDYMLCAGRDAIFSYVHNERKPFVFTPMGNNEIVDLPQRKKSKKRDEYQQMLLFMPDKGDAS